MLSAPTGCNRPDQPHLGPHPHSAQGAYLSSALSYWPLLEPCCSSVWLLGSCYVVDLPAPCCGPYLQVDFLAWSQSCILIVDVSGCSCWTGPWAVFPACSQTCLAAVDACASCSDTVGQALAGETPVPVPGKRAGPCHALLPCDNY